MRRFLAGIGLGVLLSRLDASAPQAVFEALMLRNPHLSYCALGAVFASLLVHPGRRGPAWPAILIGIGVGLCGALPLTAFVAIGEGRLSAIFIVIGVLLGARGADSLHGRAE
ncbi:MAG TPA: hypothetical protein QGF58_01380 [Myxococcota bacterium]|nr:hypothetical protein [Myxococcota bacterium]